METEIKSDKAVAEKSRVSYSLSLTPKSLFDNEGQKYRDIGGCLYVENEETKNISPQYLMTFRQLAEASARSKPDEPIKPRI